MLLFLLIVLGRFVLCDMDGNLFFYSLYLFIYFYVIVLFAIQFSWIFM